MDNAGVDVNKLSSSRPRRAVTYVDYLKVHDEKKAEREEKKARNSTPKTVNTALAITLEPLMMS